MTTPPKHLPPGKFKPYGALPLPKLTPPLLALVKTGTVYSLAVTHYEAMPVPPPMVPYTLTPRLRHGDLKDIRPASAAAEAVTMAAHTATHIDALCHVGEHRNAKGEPDANGDVHLYAGKGKTVLAKDNVTFQGQQHLSIAEMPPIVLRGVLLDVAGLKGVDVLPDSYPITKKDVQDTLKAQGTVITPGTAVCIRTGFYKHLAEGNLAYRDRIAGLALDGAKFLHKRGMVLAAADNMSVEVQPPIDHAVHRYLLVHNGVTHLENLYVDELAKNKVYEFLLIVTPLRLIGATGSWVHPIAIT